MTKAHKNAEVIKAWADGKVIQWLHSHFKTWVDFNQAFHSGPWIDGIKTWRVKPDPKKGWVRVAEHKGTSGELWTGTWADFEDKSEAEIEARIDFFRWLSPRFDFDYPEDYEGV